MLKIDSRQEIGGVTVHGDDAKDHVFYALPQSASFRLDDTGRPIFKFVKYRELREEGGDLFGGILTFDSCLRIEPAAMALVRQTLQQKVNAIYQARGQHPPAVEIGSPLYTTGTVNLSIENASKIMVQNVVGAGVPSLYGENVASFWVELTKEGATIFEQAMQGQGGFVAAFYKMKAWAKLPPISGFAEWNASKFYSFVQDINTDDNFWSEDSYTENISEWSSQHEISNVHLEMIAIPGMAADKQQALEDDLRAGLNKQLADAVQRNMLKEIQKTDPDTKSLREDDDIEDIKRQVSQNQIASVRIDLSETHTIEWPFNPPGTLQNITTMTGPDGPIQWGDYAVEVDLNDPFFRTLEVRVQVNADFEDLPIANIECKLSYPHGSEKPVKEFTFDSPDKVERFRAFLAEDNRTYVYSYTVNYENHAEPYQSPEVTTDDTQLTINVDDMGVWVVDIAPGDINFTQVKQAQVTVRLEEAATPIERQFTLTEAANTFKVREVTMRPRTGPYKVRIKYFMADGKEFNGAWQDHDAPQLYINDPFAATKAIGLRAVGDPQNKIASIAIDLTYRDEDNDYTQKRSFTLSADSAFFDWSFPVISEDGGTLSYSGTILYKDGTSSEIPETATTRSTIQVGDIVADRLEVTVVPDLLDFNTVKLVQVVLDYADPANDIVEHKDLVVKQGVAVPPWSVDLKDKTRRQFTWSAKYFLADGSHRQAPPTDTSETSLILELPAA